MPATPPTIPKEILSRKDEIAARFIEAAEEHIDNLMSGKATKRYTAADFGRRLFIHPGHLTNTLRLTLNTSVCDYMEGRLIDEAKKLLLETDLPIAAVGMHFAYEDASNFTKFFKGMTGLTPKDYRKQLTNTNMAADKKLEG